MKCWHCGEDEHTEIERTLLFTKKDGSVRTEKEYSEYCTYCGCITFGYIKPIGGKV